jgi:hypothetical protein
MRTLYRGSSLYEEGQHHSRIRAQKIMKRISSNQNDDVIQYIFIYKNENNNNNKKYTQNLIYTHTAAQV